MPEPLTTSKAAARLGLSRSTLYQWLGQSDRGELVINGHAVTINYRQTGSRGQGRILIDEAEVDRLIGIMTVRPSRVSAPPRRVRRTGLPGIIVRPGRPSD